MPAIRDLQLAEQGSTFDTVRVNERDYQFAYAPLPIRDKVVGLVSVALAHDYVTGPTADASTPFIVLIVVLMFVIIGVGGWASRQITRPLKALSGTIAIPTARRWRRRWIIPLLIVGGLLFVSLMVTIVGRVVLSRMTPYGVVYPNSLLSRFAVDYSPWHSSASPLVPLLNPDAVLAGEKELASDVDTESGVVPAAVFPDFEVIEPSIKITPTPNP